MIQRDCPPWWAFAWRGCLSVLFGALALMWPDITLLLLVGLFAAYAIITGVVMLIGAVRRHERREWLALVLGLVSIAAGVFAIIYPGLTALALIIVMGVNAVVTGALDIATAIRLKDVLRHRSWLFAVGVLSIAFGVLVLVYPGAGALALVWLISLHALLIGALLVALGISRRDAERQNRLALSARAGN